MKPTDLISWLRKRTARVAVGGEASEALQEDAFGPRLWNTFFEDAADAIDDLMFSEIRYADDLNAYMEFPGKHRIIKPEWP